MNKEDHFDRIVGLIYDSANDASEPDAMLEAIRVELLGGGGGLVNPLGTRTA